MGPRKIKCISIQETRKKNELLAEFLFGDPVQRVEPREIWARQFISPLVEFPGHVVGRQEQPWVWSRKTSSIRIAAV